MGGSVSCLCLDNSNSTQVKVVSIPLPSPNDESSPRQHTKHSTKTNTNNLLVSTGANKNQQTIKSSLRSESSRRRTFTLSKDRLAALDQNNTLSSNKKRQSLRKASITSTHQSPIQYNIHLVDSIASVNANGLINTKLTHMTVTDTDGTDTHIHNSTSPTTLSKRLNINKISHRKNVSSGEVPSSIIPTADTHISRPNTASIRKSPGSSINPLIHTHTKRRTGRNTLNDGLKSINKRRNSNDGAIMTKMALRFPVIRNSFNTVHRAFGRYILERSTKFAALNKGELLKPIHMKITQHNLGDVLRHIAHRKFSDAEISKLFALSDLDGSRCIEFREFLIAIAIGYYLEQPLDTLSEVEAETARGFMYVREAFESMDKDHSKTVDIGELKKALFSASHTQQSTAVLEARFAELDFNLDGDIELPEFLYGVVSWVGLLDEEE